MALAALACALATPLARAEGGLRKGPWLMGLRTDAVVVLAERDHAGPLRVTARAVAGDAGAAAPSGVVQADDPTSTDLHEVTLSGLSPGTRYAYEVSGPGVAPVGGTFTTPPVRAAPFRFEIYGDTRSSPAPHRAVIEAVLREGPDFAIHTGDLVEDGRDLSLWQEFFEIEAPLLRSVPFVPVIGNHEIVRPMSSGVDNYRRYVHFDPSGPSAELDAVFRFANARFILANSYDDWTGEARDWLSRELDRARREGPDDWLFVVTHWGPRSSGPHGDNDLFRDAGVDRLLRRARVDLVISGHDHAYERGDDEGIRYMVSGGGGAPLYSQRAFRGTSKVFRSVHHHVRVDVEGDHAAFTAMRPDGTVIDHATLRHDGWSDMRREPPPAQAAAQPAAPAPPEGPWADWATLAKFAPLGGLVVALSWWARRRARG